MNVKHWLVASTWILGAMGCATASPIARSPEYVEQPMEQVVAGQCHVEDDIHTIRHAIRIDQPGQLGITAAVDEGALNAEILLREPSGLFVRQIVTSPARGAYTMNVQAERGTYEVVVVCRKGTARYSMKAHYRAPIAMGDLDELR